MDSIARDLNILVAGGSNQVTAWGLLGTLVEEVRALGETISRVAE